MYLPTGLGSPQEDEMGGEIDPFGDEEPMPPPATVPTPRQFLEQNQALLQAINLEREEHEAALRRYSESISLQLRLLQDNLASQSREDSRDLRKSTQFVLGVAASIAGLTVLMVLASAWLQVWTFKQLTTKLSARNWARAPAYGLAGPGTPPSAPYAELAHPGQSQGLLSGALEQLELRLAVLERQVTARSSRVEPSPVGPASRALKQGHAPAKPRMPAQVAITVGEGEAIRFLPRDQAGSGLSWLQPLFKTLTGLFHPGRTNRPTPPVKVQLKK